MKRISKYARLTSRPISLKGRLTLSICLVLVAIVLGVASSVIVYQGNRDWFHASDRLGRLFCGDGCHIDDIPSGRGRRGYRIICRDGRGAEIGRRNNGIAIMLALPFILLIAAPALALAWKADWRETKRR